MALIKIEENLIIETMFIVALKEDIPIDCISYNKGYRTTIYMLGITSTFLSKKTKEEIIKLIKEQEPKEEVSRFELMQL